MPGQRRYAVVDLEPGNYVVVGDAFQPFGVVAGAGGTPAAGPGPAADLVVRLFEHGFAIPEGLASGRQVWEVVNAGREPHELLLARSSRQVTAEQMMELLMSESEDATPAAAGPSWADL